MTDIYDDCAQDLQCIVSDVDNIGRLMVRIDPVRNNVRDCQARIERAVTRLAKKLRHHVEGLRRESDPARPTATGRETNHYLDTTGEGDDPLHFARKHYRELFRAAFGDEDIAHDLAVARLAKLHAVAEAARELREVIIGLVEAASDDAVFPAQLAFAVMGVGHALDDLGTTDSSCEGSKGGNAP